MEMISLATGATFFNTPLPGREAAIAAIRNNQTFYGDPGGTDGLKEAIINRYKQANNVVLDPAQILVTPGTKQALLNVLSQIIRPGDEVLIPIPTWGGLQQVLAPLQAKLTPIPTLPEEGYALNPERLAKALTPQTRLLLFCNPANPTGRLYTHQEIQNILAVTAGFPDLYVLSDEIYDLVTYGERVPSLLEFPDPGLRHLVVNGFSKAFAMSGWRVGYLVVPHHLYAGTEQFQMATYGGVSEFVQAGAEAVLRQYQTALADMLPVLERNRVVMQEFLQEDGLPAFFPQAAYYFFPDLSGFLTERIPNTQALAKFLKEEFALEIQPGEHFAAPGYARLSFALEPTQLGEALSRLRKALHQLKPVPTRI